MLTDVLSNQDRAVERNSKVKITSISYGEEQLTKAIVNEVIEGVIIAVVGKLVVGRRKLLEALICNGVEVSTECCVLRQYYWRSSTSHQSVDQRRTAVLPHPEYSYKKS